MSGKTKPLEWQENYTKRSDEDPSLEVTGFEAETAFGTFYTIEVGAAWFHSVYDYRALGQFETERDAKAAAQADYETRIRSALLPDATIADLVKALEPFDAILDIFEQPAGCRPKSGDIMSWEDHRVGKRDLTVEMLRTARAALLKARGEQS